PRGIVLRGSGSADRGPGTRPGHSRARRLCRAAGAGSRGKATSMSTVERARVSTLPALIAGQRLDQPTFHERYEAMPPETRAELVGGVVYMPSPLRFDHGDTDIDVSYWLGHYKRFTKGVR